jgi:hypothetical protein
MTVENVNIEASIQSAKELIAKEKNLSPALKVALDVLLLINMQKTVWMWRLIPQTQLR